MSAHVESNGVEAHIVDDQDALVRGVVEVIAGRPRHDGFWVEKVEPSRLERTVLEDARSQGPRTSTRVEWQRTSRVIAHTEFHRGPDDLEHDPVVARVPRAAARAVGLALLAWADNDKGGAPGDASALRRDLEHEKGRVDKMLDTVLGIVERATDGGGLHRG